MNFRTLIFAGAVAALASTAAHAQDAPRACDVDPLGQLCAMQNACIADPHGKACEQLFVKVMPPGGSAGWLDTVCMTGHARSTAEAAQDAIASSAAICHQVLAAVWNTTNTIGEASGKPMICASTGQTNEQLEFVFTEFAHKLVKTDYSAYVARYSASKAALAAFMTAYPCPAK